MSESDVAVVADALEAEIAEGAAALGPREEVAPSEAHWLVRATSDGGRRVESARWGFTVPDRRRLLINARAETADRMGLVRDAFARRRCVVPADGFFEWSGPAGARRRTRFGAADGGLLLFAGLYDEAPDGQLAFTILTITPNAEVASVHDRMPVILPRARAGEWLAAPRRDLLVPAPDGALTATATPPAPRRQLSLFGEGGL